MQTCRHFKKIEVVAETLNPKKKYKIAQREALMGNPSAGVNRVWKPGARNSIFVKTKEDVDLAVDKAVESGLINLKRVGIKRFRIVTIRN
jgi:hypothetical protein